MELLVLPNNRRLAFDSGANLLEVLREHRVGISYSCMSGRCGTCRCRVIDGSVISSAAKSGDSNRIEEHYVLACQSVLTSNCAIEIIDLRRHSHSPGANHQRHGCRRRVAHSRYSPHPHSPRQAL
ncbi:MULTISPECIES: 2Fe-2S iron-sulfur cluster binding domain-containing protein [Pseudomonadaceae]|uniref:2Fe-2S iron-sulfur cluster binding domain-containing protein n=1 Tax=Pseudomonadaceae TaxID=135621 RepID=UPI001EF122E5|nr:MULTISPECIES: 2Fe-2S iron-sulfur cluster binding domain-containing protein [Pseudomonadaceae]